MSRSWGNGRSQKTDKELTRVQKIAHENKKLKEEIARLRKTIVRMDSGWCPGCLKRYDEDGKNTKLPEPDISKPEQKDRTCFKCNEGKLSIVKYYKMSEQWYYRACNKCSHRTRGKKFTPEVQD